MSKYTDLKDSAIKLLELNGHSVIEWNDYSSHMHSGFYYGKRSDTKGYGYCQYCKAEISIDLYPTNNKPQIQGECLTFECIAKNMTKDDTGLAVTAYEYCWKCNKKINPRSKTESKRGVHNKCMSANYDVAVTVLEIHIHVKGV